MSYRHLHDGWTITALTGASTVAGVPAAVPGCVHTDLLAAGLIEDPYRDDNETRLGWIGRTDWSYATSFDWQPEGHAHVDLVCEGLDTVATVIVNGTQVGQTENMHRSYRFRVTDLLTPGTNTLEILFTAPYEYAEELQATLGTRPGPYDEPYQFIRKMASNFGWDWGPTLVTSGIWKPVALHSWSGVRIASVRPLVTMDGQHGRVEVHVDVETTGGGGDNDSGASAVSNAGVGIAGGGGASSGSAGRGGNAVSGDRGAGGTGHAGRIVAEVAGVSAEVIGGVAVLEVPDAELWWPRGYGAQPLYELTVRAGDEVWTKRIGFRTVELDRDAFRFIINGRPVFARGFNWIPDDCFPTRVTKSDLQERFSQATGTGANMLRVWGGGLYESDQFYDLADELGVLIWQDFPFACAAYPEDEPLRSEVIAEARENVTRLMPHPSLVLWCGNNENIEGHQHWQWQETLGTKSWGAGFYFDVLPGIMSELDPGRPYWPGSPYSGVPDRDVCDPSTGTIHIWTVWGQRDYTFYDTYTPRFVAEFGFQGPATHATLRSAISGPLTLDSPLLAHHQKATDGAGKLLRGLGAHLWVPGEFFDWSFYTQLNQARAVAYGVQRFRALMPYCMGTLVWQLNDCWPAISWAAVDGGGRRKPLWYAMRRAYADRLLTFQDNSVALVNDTDQPWTGELTVTRRSVTGEPLAKEGFAVSVPPRDVVTVELPSALATAGNAAQELLAAEFGTERALKMLAEDPVMAYPPAAFDADVQQTASGATVQITARTLLRELAIFPDQLDPQATVDDQLVTLLPGESVTFQIQSSTVLDPEALVSYPVLRCVNERKDRPQ